MSRLLYEILIPTIPHRHDKLCALLERLNRQIPVEGLVGVRLYRSDYGDPPLHAKFQALMEASTADYISWLDDDDSVAGDFVASVVQALTDEPDYVGFPVEYSVDGVVQMPVEHSLRHPEWLNLGTMLARDITALNPIRRKLALLGKWEPPDHGADSNWARQIRETGLLTREAFIPRPMYFYKFSTTDSFLTPREPWGEEPFPALPVYPWLVEGG